MAEPSMEAPSGLGNFKGVMLCNRPEEGPKAAETGPQPFKSACAPTYGEQLGLNPPVREPDPMKQPEKQQNQALVRHHKWLKQLSEEMTEAKREDALDAADQEKRQKAVKDFCERQRQQVKELREEAKKVNKVLSKKEVAAAVEGRLKKPKWARTEKENADMDEEETLELLDFADNLNFDEYMNDLEFREAVQAMNGRVNKLQSEQNNFREMLAAQFNEADGDEAAEAAPGDEGDIAVEGHAAIEDDQASFVTSHTGISGDRERKHRRKEESDWDASTRTSETTSVDSERRDLADRVLAENADMRSVHSAASVQRMIEKVEKEKAAEKAKAAQAAVASLAEKEAKVQALVAALGEQKAPPAPLIQVHVEDARCNKPVDPSMLPYLYRSPAI